MEAGDAQILIIDPSAEEAERLAEHLRGAGFDCQICIDGAEATGRAASGHFDAVLTESGMDDFSGLRLIKELHASHPRLPVVMLTDQAGSDTAIEAIKAGAYDFLTKPVDLEELTEILRKSVGDAQRMSTPVEIGQVYDQQDTIVGKSRGMREIYKQLGRIAAQPVTVLIRGETGTGKELIARAIYQHGHRAHRPFVAVNCAAIPESLLESELFGHERGAFTGADKLRIGRFEQAHNGTLFLDEIGDLDLPLQAKLLRVLQEKTIQRVGGNDDIPVDVRIIAATHRNLEEMVGAGTFREDLFYRLNVVALDIPPLRERREDIPLLIDYFLQRHAPEFGIEAPSIHSKAVEFLQNYHWPGNIRELQNIIRKLLLMSRGYTIGWQDCRVALENTEQPGKNRGNHSLTNLVSDTLTRVINGELENALPTLTDAFERQVYTQAIQRSGGNQAKAARWLGVSRLTLREKLRHFGIHPNQ